MGEQTQTHTNEQEKQEQQQKDLLQFKKNNPTAGGPDVGQTPANKPGMSHD